MAQEQDTGQDSGQDRVREFLADSDKLLRSGEKNLQRFEKLREAMGLNPGASAAFLAQFPANSSLQKQARALVAAMETEAAAGDLGESPADKKKLRKRSKLARAMQRRLRI